MKNPTFLVEAGITYVFDAPEERDYDKNANESDEHFKERVKANNKYHDKALTLAKENKRKIADQEKGKDLICRNYFDGNLLWKIEDGVYSISGLRIKVDEHCKNCGARHDKDCKEPLKDCDYVSEPLAHILPFEDEKEKTPSYINPNPKKLSEVDLKEVLENRLEKEQQKANEAYYYSLPATRRDLKNLEDRLTGKSSSPVEGQQESQEEKEAKEWELWRDFLYDVGSNRRFLNGEDWNDTEWEKLMDILKEKGYSITRKP